MVSGRFVCVGEVLLSVVVLIWIKSSVVGRMWCSFGLLLDVVQIWSRCGAVAYGIIVVQL